MKRVLVLLNGSSPFFDYWESNVNWVDLELEPIFCSIHPPLRPSNYTYIQIPGKTKAYRYYNLLIQLPKIIEDNNVDFIHAHFLEHHGMISILRSSVPVFLTLYGSDVQRYPPILGRLFRKQFEKVRIFHAQSLFTLYSINKKIPNIFSKLYHKTWGVNPHFLQKSNIDKSNSEMIYFSPRSIKYNYNTIDIVEAFLEVDPANSKLILAVGTADKQHPYTKKVLKMASKSDKITIYDRFLSPEEMKQLYSEAHFSIQIPDNDQVALSIIESMACGTLPILSDLKVYQQELPDSLVKYAGNKEALKDIFSSQNLEEQQIKQHNLIEFAEGYGSFRRNMTRIFSKFLTKL